MHPDSYVFRKDKIIEIQEGKNLSNIAAIHKTLVINTYLIKLCLARAIPN